MKDSNSFKLTYSAGQQEEIRSIRMKYMPREEDKMERLRALDASAGKKASRVAVSLGVLGALVMGLGMSLIMTDLGNVLGDVSYPVGVAIGIVGMVPVALAYPLYGHTLKRERARIAPEIIRLTDELMK